MMSFDFPLESIGYTFEEFLKIKELVQKALIETSFEKLK